MGFVMQGNNVGLVLGPAMARAIAGAAGWPAVSFLLAAMAVAAALLGLLFRARPAEQALAAWTGNYPIPALPGCGRDRQLRQLNQ